MNRTSALRAVRKCAAYLTGHKTRSVLMQIYTHLQADEVCGAVSKLSLGLAKVGDDLAVARKRAQIRSKRPPASLMD